ncbi:MAG: TolC family protein [Bacteroidetes bacterium]|nr:TolC family protein [Bacteroidota bacterium]
MNYLRKVLPLLICVGPLSASYAIPGVSTDTLTLTLPDAWNRAASHSRAIEIRRKAAAAAQEGILDAQMERLPDINIAGSVLGATNMPVYENGLSAPSQHDVIHVLYSAGTDFYLNLYNGNKNNLKVKENKALYQMALIQQDQTVSNIRYQAASLYLELQKSTIFRDLIQKDIVDQERQLREIQSLNRNGVVLKSDVLRVELDLSKRRMTLVQIQNDISIASQKLNILIGEPDEKIISPVSPTEVLTKDPGSYEECLNMAMDHSYALHLSEQQTSLSRLHLRQIRANVRPTVGLMGDFHYGNPQIMLYPYNAYWYSIGIGGIKASFPISSFYHNIYKTRTAKIELEQEEEAHRDQEDHVRQQVREAYLRYRESLVQIDVALVSVDRAVENERIIRSAYFNQAALITDLLDADIQVLQTRFDLEAARITAQDRYYLLENIIGNL